MAAAGLELNLPDLPEVPIRLGNEGEPPPVVEARRARAPWRIRVRDALTAYLPLLLMVLLALSTWWLVKNSPQAPRPAGARAATGEPDYTLRGFGLQRFAADGSLQLTVEGRQLHHFPDSDRVDIEEVRLTTTDTQAPATVATARRARSNGKATDVELLGGAQVRTRTADGQVLEIDSEYLRVQTPQQRISTTKPVELRVGNQVLKAGGLTWDHAAKVLELLPPVRAVMRPAAGSPS